jgi:hypothetical protein
MTEALRSTRANKLVNCASTFPITGGRLAARSSLGPSAVSREAAVAAARPREELSSTPKTSVGDRAEMLPAVTLDYGNNGKCRTSWSMPAAAAG